MAKAGGEDRIEQELEQSVNSKAAAAFLNMNYKTLERKARYHEVPASRQGRHWQFLLSLLDEWRRNQMKSNLKTPNTKDDKSSK